MEKIQVIQPTKLLAPYIKQYWFLRIDDVKQGFQRSIPAGCVALVFHKGNKIISSFHKGTQPQSYISGQISTYFPSWIWSLFYSSLSDAGCFFHILWKSLLIRI